MKDPEWEFACEGEDELRTIRNCSREDLGTRFGGKFEIVFGDGTKLHTCPCGVISERSMALLQLFFDCHSQEQGLSSMNYRLVSYPYEGGTFDQPAIIIQAFSIIRETIAKIQAKQDKEK